MLVACLISFFFFFFFFFVILPVTNKIVRIFLPLKKQALKCLNILLNERQFKYSAARKRLDRDRFRSAAAEWEPVGNEKPPIVSSFIPKQTQRCSFLFFVFFQQPPAVNLLHHNYTLVCTKVNHVYDQIGVSPFERAANGDDCVSSAQVQQRPVHQRSGRGGGGRRNEGVTAFTSLHCLLFSPCENFFVLFLFAFFKFFFFFYCIGDQS